MIKPAGRRLKGKRLELQVAKLWRKIDPSAKRMVLSGADWAFKGDLYTTLPYHIEIKNQEKMHLWDWWDQCTSDCSMNKTPILVHSANFRPIMATLKLDDLISLLAQIHN